MSFDRLLVVGGRVSARISACYAGGEGLGAPALPPFSRSWQQAGERFIFFSLLSLLLGGSVVFVYLYHVAKIIPFRYMVTGLFTLVARSVLDKSDYRLFFSLTPQKNCNFRYCSGTRDGVFSFSETLFVALAVVCLTAVAVCMIRLF